ncbi:MAG: hypothetical protein ACXQS4_02105, partial [Methermicoccaceae archaeon]
MDAHNYLTTLFEPYTQGLIELRAIGANGAVSRTYPLDGVDALLHDAHIYDTTREYHTITFGVLPRVHEIEQGKAGRKEDVVKEGFTVWVDVDGLFTEPPTNEEVEEARIEVLNALPLGYLPRVCVCSGHGLHFYFTLNEPLPIQDIERVNKALVEHLKKEGIEGADSQSTDAARVMRLPDTMNRKSEPEIPCKVVYISEGASVWEDTVRKTLAAHRDKKATQTQAPTQRTEDVDVDKLVEVLKPHWTEGNRHALTLGLAAQLKKAGVPLGEALHLVQGVISQFEGDVETRDRLTAVSDTYTSEDRVAYLKHYTGLMSEGKARALSNSIFKLVDKTQFGGVLNDDTNARLFISRYGTKIRWCEPIGGWYIWSGKRWEEDHTCRIITWAKETVEWAREQSGMVGESEQDAINRRKWYIASGNLVKIKAMIELAKPDVAVMPSQFDA